MKTEEELNAWFSNLSSLKRFEWLLLANIVVVSYYSALTALFVHGAVVILDPMVPSIFKAMITLGEIIAGMILIGGRSISAYNYGVRVCH